MSTISLIRFFFFNNLCVCACFSRWKAAFGRSQVHSLMYTPNGWFCMLKHSYTKMVDLYSVKGKCSCRNQYIYLFNTSCNYSSLLKQSSVFPAVGKGDAELKSPPEVQKILFSKSEVGQIIALNA